MSKEKLVDALKRKFSLEDKEAIGLILSGDVLVNNSPVTKPGIKVPIDAEIRIREKEKYVSRGAYKLLYALEKFSIKLDDKVCIDCGSSSGGFTQVLLEKNAKKVYAIDCGINQLHYSLRINPKVVVMENNRIADINKDIINEDIDLAVMDLSFCSSLPQIKHLKNVLRIKEIIVLMKPQYEYENLKDKLGLTKEFVGIVKNESDRNKIINFVKKEIIDMGMVIINIIQSAIKGMKGNIEYFFHIKY